MDFKTFSKFIFYNNRNNYLKQINKLIQNKFNFHIVNLQPIKPNYNRYFMKNSIPILFFLSIQLSLSQSPPCSPVTYDYHVLSLTWPEEFCLKAGVCDSHWRDNWDNRTLTIHGFWPSSTNLAYLTCQREYGHDPYCYNQYTYSSSHFTSTQLSLLNKYWPQFTVQKTLWQHQWEKHGTCYLHIQKNVFQNVQSQLSIFKKYYLDTVNRARTLDIFLYPGQIKTKVDLANVIKRRPSQFLVVCQSGRYLSQIKICFSLNRNVGQQKVADCPTSIKDTSCTYPIIINGSK